MTIAGTPVIALESVRKYYALTRTLPWKLPLQVHAVDDVSLEVHEHETLAVVGESGSGKTTAARLLLGLDRPTAGRVLFRGIDIARLNTSERRNYRASVQAVLQDPWGSLDPRMRVRDIVAEPLVVNERLSRAEILGRVVSGLEAVGLDSSAASRFPHEFSGGQRQRIAIARALTLDPTLVILDEPISSLDVSVAAQVMNLLKALQRKRGTAYVLIAHNLATVRHLSDRVSVMYAGRVVETASSHNLFSQPFHPYTKSLLAAVLPLRTSTGGRYTQASAAPDFAGTPAPQPGCSFRSRCPLAFARCSSETPDLRRIADGHYVACHFQDDGTRAPAATNHARTPSPRRKRRTSSTH